MSELPRTDDLPRAEDGLDPARVEEAFERFGERVRELESVAADLRAELRALRAERPPPAAARYADEEWPDAAGPPADWVGAIPPPLVRTFAVPRLALETVFLLGVGLFAGLADLSPEWIVGLMAGAWLLVVLSEWTAAAKRASWRLEEIPPPVETPAEDAGESTGPWSMPVVEATVVEAPDASESHTMVAALPAPTEVTDETPAEATDEPAAEPPAAARRRWWRRKPAEPQAPDPWES
jgi:hypothetical protein